MKTLVLGGTGFVGRRLVEILIADGAGVTVLNRGVTPVELPAGVTRWDSRRSTTCGPATPRPLSGSAGPARP
jgi:uncharacterized protein YbjT (DUF2867 family)